MNNFNFGEVLTRAWQIIWKHKILWVFGILASFARGSGGGSSGGGNSGYQGGSGNSPFSTGRFEQIMGQAGQFIQDNLLIIVAVVIVDIVIDIVVVIVATADIIAVVMVGAVAAVAAVAAAEVLPIIMFGLVTRAATIITV